MTNHPFALSPLTDVAASSNAIAGSSASGILCQFQRIQALTFEWLAYWHNDNYQNELTAAEALLDWIEIR